MIFYKYHGTGNDFIMVDNLNGELKITKEQIRKICERHFGIGADGFIAIERSEKASFYMRYYNSDGNLSTMCGNGGRCSVLFAKHLGVVDSNEIYFEAADGIHYAQIIDNDNVALKMNLVSEPKIVGNSFVINTGSPHYVRFTYSVDTLNVKKEGATIRNSAQFKREGINVNFVEENSNSLFVRTYERGVEDETLSCGTGVTAAALCLYMKQNYRGHKKIFVETLGGKLKVQIESQEYGKIDKVWLIGPAKQVFVGDVNL